MTATEELSRMLDERGKEHRVWPSGLVIWHDEGSWVYEYSPPKGDDDYWGGILHATLRHCTPEQAVAATLGRGTCRRVLMDCAGNPPYYMGGFALNDTCNGCSECGYPWRTHGLETPNYCPNCGRRVEQ